MNCITGGVTIVTPMEDETIASRLKNLREIRGFSQGQLAQRSGVSRSLISLIEQGLRNPKLDTLELLAKALHTDVMQLLYAPGEVIDYDADIGGDINEDTVNLITVKELDPVSYQSLRVIIAGMRDQALRRGKEERDAIQRRRDAQLAGPADSEVPPTQSGPSERGATE